MDCRRVTWLSPIPRPVCPIQRNDDCSKISRGEGRTRQVEFDDNFNVAPVAPLCQLVSAKMNQKTTAKDNAAKPEFVKGLCRPVCIAVPKKHYDDSVENVRPIEEYKYRWKNETCQIPSSTMVGYKTLPFARPIPGYNGFKPRFPYHVPQQSPKPTTIELTSGLREQYSCPDKCENASLPYRRGPLTMCVAQLHPYVPFSAAAKLTNTW